jgi:hypothetical protein
VFLDGVLEVLCFIVTPCDFLLLQNRRSIDQSNQDLEEMTSDIAMKKVHAKVFMAAWLDLLATATAAAAASGGGGGESQHGGQTATETTVASGL